MDNFKTGMIIMGIVLSVFSFIGTLISADVGDVGPMGGVFLGALFMFYFNLCCLLVSDE